MATQATKRPAAKTTNPKTVNDYLAAAPKATEGISYGVVGFKHNGKALVYFGYAKAHCALYGGGSSFIDAHASDLQAYDLSKGTIRFHADKPLPDRLVTKLVKTRVAEIERAC